MPADVPLRRSLVTRLLATSVLIAVCSIAATAWLAVHTTTTAIQHQQVQILADDASIYDALLGYAATHPDWSGAAATVRELADRTGRRVALTTPDHQPIADSAAQTTPLPTETSAVLDPLRIDPALGSARGSTSPRPDGSPTRPQGRQTPRTDPGRIDPRAVGPYLLPAAERDHLHTLAQKISSCLAGYGRSATTSDQPSGRPVMVLTDKDDLIRAKVADDCGVGDLARPTTTEQQALTRLDALTADCLTHQHLPAVHIGTDFQPVTPPLPGHPDADQAARTCIDAGRREQLAGYVAPAALLYLTGTAESSTRVLHLSPASTYRIVTVTAAVLLLAVTVTVTVGARLVRPLRALTAAARRPEHPHQRVPVTTRDEIGYLAAAFNDQTERRERVEEKRKALVSDIAHELRTPLTNIRCWLEAAHDGIVVADGAFTSSLLEEALLLQHIMDDLQDLAAADAGPLRLHPEPLDLDQVLAQVAAAHHGRARSAGITLTARTEEALVLTADPLRLRQALGNLLSNALRHTPEGGRVELRARRADDEVVIEVLDTGTGIAPADLPRVFDRFWRADRSRNRSSGGSGLGLAIVRQLTEAHGGTASVSSTPHTGTVFTLRLPAGNAPRRATHHPPARTAGTDK
ncbi:HAMP domain-containing sensor histidine kinase [Kitasatospora sp. NPDC049258]|uniref:HAMP domain-containing sensor histidine kinase n=1 Tax=Kitasatospora sp. NPDC049258 TaxID=3155394 RepID=UPI0034289B76